jgi:uncharacterized protein YcbK (DUF882 family)
MKNFNVNEFDSPDEIGSGEFMDQDFLFMLDKAREFAGGSFVITSGYRTESHNSKVGGVSNSSHRKGLACDIACSDSRKRSNIITALLAVGFTRIGVASSFIHVDNDSDKSQDVIWTY